MRSTCKSSIRIFFEVSYHDLVAQPIPPSVFVNFTLGEFFRGDHLHWHIEEHTHIYAIQSGKYLIWGRAKPFIVGNVLVSALCTLCNSWHLYHDEANVMGTITACNSWITKENIIAVLKKRWDNCLYGIGCHS